MSTCVEFDWEAVGSVAIGQDGKLTFPRLPEAPGVYLLRLVGGEDTSVYVGETVSLRRRAGNYRNPGPTQRTSIRINALLLEHLVRGGQVEMAIANPISIESSGEAVPLDLWSEPQRLLVENAALIAVKAANVERIENL